MKQVDYDMTTQNNNASRRSPAMEQLKFETANEVGVPLKQGYNGDLTSKQAGSIGGAMVKKMIATQMEQMGGQ